MGMCGKCSKMTSGLFLIFGVLFLLRDLGKFEVWGLTGWTVLFLIVGVTMCGKSCCKDCQMASKK